MQRTFHRPFSLIATLVVLMSSMVLTTPEAGASGTHAPEPMPNVVGLTKAQVFAVMRADQLFFRTKGPGSANGTWVSVTSEIPAAGTLVPWRSTVILTTTLVAVHPPRRVPNLVGLTPSRVVAAMKAAELYFVPRGPGSATGKWGRVVHQSPAPGTLVAWHASVAVTTALGAQHPRERVPSLLGLSRARADAVLAADHLRIKTRGPGSASNTWTKIVRQSPAPGTLVAWNGTVVATVTIIRAHPSSPSPTTTIVPPTTSTTYPGETTSPTTTEPPTTTTTPPTTTTVHRSVSRDYRVGVATWYSYIPGRCATWFLPMGIHVRVIDLATGRSVTCVVTDHEAARGDRVIDLSETDFARLEPLAKGVIDVRVSW
ncbi:MAG: PASTA domain-containing protein [Acidobacteria bacterium]|nr:PASTA domain-containing protein [Acidobacteriota bacterium]